MTVPADPFATMPPDRPPKPASKTKGVAAGRLCAELPLLV